MNNLMPRGFFSSRLDVSAYTRFLDGCLCWHDGTPTHRSSGTQRQCPKCRLKWNFEGRRMHLRLLVEYCKGTRAGEAGRLAGASRNTAQATFRTLDRRATGLVKTLHRQGGIAVVTEKSTMRDLERVRRHHGKRTPAEAVSRRIFFHGMDANERLHSLIVPDLEDVLRSCLCKLPSAARRTVPAASELLLRRSQMTDQEWGFYIRSVMARSSSLSRSK